MSIYNQLPNACIRSKYRAAKVLLVEVQQMSYSWISTAMEREHGTFGRRTLTLCRRRWSLLMEFWRRHEASIVHVSTGLQVSLHGHMRRGLRSGLVVNQATTQRRWLVTTSWYDSQGFIVRCGCVSASCTVIESGCWSPMSSALIGPSLHVRGEGNGFWRACLGLTWNYWAEQSRCVVDVSHYRTWMVHLCS